ncbi:zinc finger protein CONSTANS-LIKE 9-like isoform X1 [Phragmites australis]|uniref:zinc finger protein CONSTANS-LIKE 9-like isoform X1 n=1 Tax=Phragmites australis TaxID=29695 RepID=UPI002D7A284C|nr:zinc finger protein CONSTANS-LIKE 9-like isoform X1 [Phragmites australis]
MAGSAALLSGHGDEFFAQEDWPILHDVGLDDFNFDSNLSNSVNPIGRTEGVFEPQASASLGYDRPSISSCSETIMPSDAFLQSLTSNSAACQFSSVGTNTSSNVMLPRDELPSRHFGFEVPSAASQEAPPPEKSSQDMEARTKQREKRQQAKQRYNDKKKNRRFGKQIMYVSRKARADTRNRVKGRFAKASSSAHGDNPDMQP